MLCRPFGTDVFLISPRQFSLWNRCCKGQSSCVLGVFLGLPFRSSATTPASLHPSTLHRRSALTCCLARVWFEKLRRSVAMCFCSSCRFPKFEQKWLQEYACQFKEEGDSTSLLIFDRCIEHYPFTVLRNTWSSHVCFDPKKDRLIGH